MQICTCSQCILNTVYNKKGQPVSGKYLASRSIAIHRAADFKQSNQDETFATHPNDIPDSPPIELPESSEYSEDSTAFSGLDENENNFHLCELNLISLYLIAVRTLSSSDFCPQVPPTPNLGSPCEWIHNESNIEKPTTSRQPAPSYMGIRWDNRRPENPQEEGRILEERDYGDFSLPLPTRR
ncbi:hypothetical protein H4Q26_002319 [Puccinia striiformis f. sp. tritici PST-130]|nr:hypothetical protein H4Q26_002319 [Puccinia striiformis f. sp. tritici PST-130]